MDNLLADNFARRHNMPRYGPVFEAKYGSKCGLCDRRFPAGERIRYIAKNTVAHEKCVVSDERARKNMRSHKLSTWRLGKSPSSYG
jgi:hypothetical protein